MSDFSNTTPVLYTLLKLVALPVRGHGEGLRRDHMLLFVGDDDQDPEQVPHDDCERVRRYSRGLLICPQLVQLFQVRDQLGVLLRVRTKHLHVFDHTIDQGVDLVLSPFERVLHPLPF